jgi:fucose 4-O-acetylase-like acetyltransferase
LAALSGLAAVLALSGLTLLSRLAAVLALSELTALLIPLVVLMALSGLTTLLILLFHIVCHKSFLLARREPPRALKIYQHQNS